MGELDIQLVAPEPCGLGRLTDPVGQTGDELGGSISLWGDRLAVGAVFADGLVVNSGRVALYRRPGVAWEFDQHIQAADGSSGDVYGASVSHDGQTLAVGAPGAGDGAAYVYDWDGSTYVFVTKLLPGVGGTDFGRVVAVQGDRLLVGAPLDDTAGFNVGSVYSYRQAGGAWNFQGIVAPVLDGALADGFGSAVEMDGDVAVVGSPGHGASGAVYILTKTAASWVIDTKLEPLDLPGSVGFGTAVAIEGDLVVAGTPYDHTEEVTAGAAYVFQRSGVFWSFFDKLTDPNSLDRDYLGYSVDIAPDGRVFLGAPGSELGTGMGIGRAVCFIPGPTRYARGPAYASPSPQPSEFVGRSVAFDGLSALAGATGSALPGAYTGSVLSWMPDDCGVAYCHGEGSCPCGNTSMAGGCANSLNLGGVLTTMGSNSVGADDLTLLASNLPSGFGIFIASENAQTLPFGNGLLCLGPGIIRLSAPLPVNAAGELGFFGVHAASLGAIDAGELWNFQGWYRDAGGPCLSSFNFTNAYALVFGP